MCGIGGFLIKNNQTVNYEKILKKMSTSLFKEGQMMKGYWHDKKSGIFLFHRRLSILDLSKNGLQPMISQNERYIITFNGEIYNFNIIAKQLRDTGTTFKSQSDTEVIIEAFSKWGIEKSVRKFIGMFAIGVWDRKNRSLYLIRDRLGIKPLYWGSSNENFYFSSTIDALNEIPFASNKISKLSISLYLNYGYIPSENSIFENIKKVKPGFILTIDKNNKVSENCFWNLEDQVKLNYNTNKFKTFEEAKNEIESLIKDSVKLRMISDAPIGSFLSGGIDSSLITGLMQQQSNKKIKTFSIGFNDESYNEANYAKKIAAHLRTDHNELYLDNKHLLDIIPKIHQIYDEPFFDSSSIPTFLLSQFTSGSVKVALSGDGGDELFAGYNRYKLARKISKFNKITPHLFRLILNKIIKIIPQSKYDVYSFKMQKNLAYMQQVKNYINSQIV